ncbi:MAG: folate-binding protein, partial [Lacisediminimonas sp.]|nr:folate-binding protein [Lacisediminimonas sp.]
MSALPSHWLQFLQEHGAGNTARSADAPQDNFVAPLTHLGTIAVSGEDAAKFLHAQLTNDIEQLTPGEARLAGYCSAKGRMLASMLAWRDGDTVTLQLPQDLLPAI